jgi:hypothetical protein
MTFYEFLVNCDPRRQLEGGAGRFLWAIFWGEFWKRQNFDRFVEAGKTLIGDLGSLAFRAGPDKAF